MTDGPQILPCSKSPSRCALADPFGSFFYSFPSAVFACYAGLGWLIFTFRSMDWLGDFSFLSWPIPLPCVFEPLGPTSTPTMLPATPREYPRRHQSFFIRGFPIGHYHSIHEPFLPECLSASSFLYSDGGVGPLFAGKQSCHAPLPTFF